MEGVLVGRRVWWYLGWVVQDRQKALQQKVGGWCSLLRKTLKHPGYTKSAPLIPARVSLNNPWKHPTSSTYFTRLPGKLPVYL